MAGSGIKPKPENQRRRKSGFRRLTCTKSFLVCGQTRSTLIRIRKGFVLLTGEVGTGKTTLINKLLEWLRLQQVATAFIFNSRMNVPQFLDYMMTDFGIPCDSRAKSQVLLRLYNWLLDRYRAGETAVLIVDEAQNLSDEVLEE